MTSAVLANSGTTWIPVAPAPITPTLLPRQSKSCSHRAEWKHRPLNFSIPLNFGTFGLCKNPMQLMRKRPSNAALSVLTFHVEVSSLQIAPLKTVFKTRCYGNVRKLISSKIQRLYTIMYLFQTKSKYSITNVVQNFILIRVVVLPAIVTEK